MKKIYVCYRPQTDVEKVRSFCRYVKEEFGFLPIAPILYFPQFYEDYNLDEGFGKTAGLSLLCVSDEVWYFGDNISKTVTEEICFAMSRGKTVKYIPEYLYVKYLKEKEK